MKNIYLQPTLSNLSCRIRLFIGVFLIRKLITNPAPFLPFSMTDLVRQEIATSAQLIVVKVGTRVLTRSDGRLNPDYVRRLAEEIYTLRSQGRRRR